MKSKKVFTLAMGLIAIFLGGCSIMGQNPNVVEIRDPGTRTYREEPTSATAPLEWEYAVMSENAYRDHWSMALRLEATGQLLHPLAAISTESLPVDCTADTRTPLPLPGWYRWADFPENDPALEKDADKQQLFFEVWQKGIPGEVVAIVFRGTVPSKWKTWLADFRWVLPLHKDQYTVAAGKLAEDFSEEVRRRVLDHSLRTDVRLVATGHSLGGGLAQQIAYVLPIKDNVPRISEVYAFDPSPVTGYFSIDSGLRDTNKQNLQTRRIFEHGEILAYLRLFLSYVVPPSAEAPAVSEIRYNFDPSWNIVENHSMTMLACGISRAAGNR